MFVDRLSFWDQVSKNIAFSEDIRMLVWGFNTIAFSEDIRMLVWGFNTIAFSEDIRMLVWGFNTLGSDIHAGCLFIYIIDFTLI